MLAASLGLWDQRPEFTTVWPRAGLRLLVDSGLDDHVLPELPALKLEVDEHQWAMKAMNCPGHCYFYNTRKHSYRDLPLRYGEFGACHRNEPSGALHGLLRVRGFVQDDGHIFCTEAQVESEVGKSQREYYLREQLKAIHRELGNEDADDGAVEVQFASIVGRLLVTFYDEPQEHRLVAGTRGDHEVAGRLMRWITWSIPLSSRR